MLWAWQLPGAGAILKLGLAGELQEPDWYLWKRQLLGLATTWGTEEAQSTKDSPA